MIGFDDGEEKTRILDGRAVATINANLTATADIASAARLAANAGAGFMGITHAGPFDLPFNEVESLLRQPKPTWQA